MPETCDAVLDRIVDDVHATLLLEARGETVDEFVIDVSDLPESGRHEGAVFRATIEDGTLASLAYRPEESRERANDAQDRLDRLSRPLSDEDS